MTEKKRWIVLVSVSALAAIGIGVLIYFQHESIQERRDQIAKLEKQIAEDRELIKKTPDLIKEVIIQRETDEVIKEILSDEEDINNFVRTLRSFEESSGISISSIKQQRGARNKKKKESFDRVGYTLSFDADAFQLLAFLDKVETHPRLMSVTAFKLSSARRAKANEIPRHKVQLDLETYVYMPKSGSQEVRIDQYERKRDLLVSEISKRTGELQVPVYTYGGQRGRRDPWVDPRVPVDSEGGPVLSIEEQIAIVDDLVEQADEIKAVWELVQTADNLIEEMKARADLEEKLALLEEEIRRVQEEGTLVFIPAARRFDSDVVATVENVRFATTNTEAGSGPSLIALREAAEAMERHLQNGEYELALAAFDTVENRLTMAEKDEIKLPLVQALHELRRLAQTVIEFETIRLDISGIAVYEEHRPVALINGTAVSEGELVGEELIVRNITKEQIEFAFRGMVLAVPVEGPQ